MVNEAFLFLIVMTKHMNTIYLYIVYSLINVFIRDISACIIVPHGEFFYTICYMQALDYDIMQDRCSTIQDEYIRGFTKEWFLSFIMFLR